MRVKLERIELPIDRVSSDSLVDAMCRAFKGHLLWPGQYGFDKIEPEMRDYLRAKMRAALYAFWSYRDEEKQTEEM